MKTNDERNGPSNIAILIVCLAMPPVGLLMAYYRWGIPAIQHIWKVVLNFVGSLLGIISSVGFLLLLRFVGRYQLTDIISILIILVGPVLVATPFFILSRFIGRLEAAEDQSKVTH